MKNQTTFEITWEVEDGYVSTDRPQYFEFDILDYVESLEEWNKLSVEERTDILYAVTRDEFDNNISFDITNDCGLLD